MKTLFLSAICLLLCLQASATVGNTANLADSSGNLQSAESRATRSFEKNAGSLQALTERNLLREMSACQDYLVLSAKDEVDVSLMAQGLIAGSLSYSEVLQTRELGADKRVTSQNPVWALIYVPGLSALEEAKKSELLSKLQSSHAGLQLHQCFLTQDTNRMGGGNKP